MKALGSGLGAFALRDVEVVRAAGPGAGRRGAVAAPRRPGPPPWPPSPAGGPLARLAHPHRRSWPWPWWWPRAPGSRRWLRSGVRPVVTVAEMRAADAAALADGRPVRPGPPGRARRGPLGPRLLGSAYGRRVVVVAGKGNNGADGRVAAAVLRRRGARVRGGRRRRGAPTASPPCDLVIDAAYGTGFRAATTPPGPPAATAGAGGRHPLGGRRRHRRGLRPAARRPTDRDLRRPEARPAAGRRAGRWPAEVEVADIGVPVDGAGDRRWSRTPTWPGLPHRPPGRPQVGHRGRWWWPGRRAWRGRPSSAAGGAGHAGAGMVRLGVPGTAGRPLRPAPGRSRRCAWPCRRRAGPTSVLEGSDRCRALVIGPGLGRSEPTVERRPPVIVGQLAGAGGGRRRRPLRPGRRRGRPPGDRRGRRRRPVGRLHPPRRRVRRPGRRPARARPGGGGPAPGRRGPARVVL